VEEIRYVHKKANKKTCQWDTSGWSWQNTWKVALEITYQKYERKISRFQRGADGSWAWV